MTRDEPCMHPVARALGLAAVLSAIFAIAPSFASAEGTCPNQQLRAETHSTTLPDCRAYELVTPPFKNGQPVGSGYSSIAADGSALNYDSLGAFGEAGDDSTSEGTAYLTQHTPSGWLSNSLTPPATQFLGTAALTGASPDDVSENLSENLFARVPNPSPPIDVRFYRGTPAAGYTLIGPAAPKAKVEAWSRSEAETGNVPEVDYAGASAELTHVLFTSNASYPADYWLFPGDSTVGQRSLYEYGAANSTEPSLVAVRNNGVLHGTPHVNDGAELITQCGAGLGYADANRNGQGADTYNAISRDGATVFFTAFKGGCAGITPAGEPVTGEGPPVNEVYARLQGASTLAISKPVLPAGESCTAGCASAAPKQGIFQGASSDGSKVFFLTEQPLLNSDQNLTSDLYEEEIQGHGATATLHKVLQISAAANPAEAAEVQGVARVSEQGSRVYFVAKGLLTSKANAAGKSPTKGAENLYVYDASSGQTAFIASLAPGDSEDWSNVDSRPVQATPDGRFLLFASTNDLTSEGTGETRQLYRYDAEDGQLLRVSIGSAGYNQNGEKANAFSITQDYFKYARAAPAGVGITSDGSKIFFASAAALTPQALDNACAVEVEGQCEQRALNVYEYELGNVYLISDGLDRGGLLDGSAVTLLGANPSGSDVFFTTADRLVAQDTDTQVDIYDAHVGGGFPAPSQPVSCGAECRSPSAPPQLTTPLSSLPGGSQSPPAATGAQPTARPPTRAQKLIKALKACRARTHGRRRAACEAAARKRYGRAHRARKPSPGGR